MSFSSSKSSLQWSYAPAPLTFEDTPCFCSVAYHPCSSNNGYCTHLCLLNPTGNTCACPDEEDGRSCSTSPVPPTAPSPTTEPPTTTQQPATAPVDYCAPQPCENGAACEMIGNDNKCHCERYYAGKNCSVELCKLHLWIVLSYNVIT